MIEFPSAKEFLGWHYQTDLHDISIPQEEKISGFLKSWITKLTTPETSRDLFVVDVFHAVAGCIFQEQVLTEEARTAIKSYVSTLWGGKGFRSIHPESPHARIMQTSSLPEDLYSTYYSLGLLILAGYGFSEYLDKIREGLGAYLQPSGWAYNASWTETIEERRFDIELCQQALMAVRIAVLVGLDPKALPYSEARKEKISGYLLNPRYMTALFYSIQCLYMINKETKLEEAVKHKIVEFVLAHFSREEGGFLEYRLEDVKVFYYRGVEGKSAQASHRYQSDFMAASINATTYALLMASSKGIDELLEYIKSKKGEISNFFANQEQGEEGGFGSIVKVAKYSAFFGPRSTALESISWHIGRQIISTM